MIIIMIIIATALNGGYRKEGPKISRYRNYAKFFTEDLRKDLCEQISPELMNNEYLGPSEAGGWEGFSPPIIC